MLSSMLLLFSSFTSKTQAVRVSLYPNGLLLDQELKPFSVAAYLTIKRLHKCLFYNLCVLYKTQARSIKRLIEIFTSCSRQQGSSTQLPQYFLLQICDQCSLAWWSKKGILRRGIELSFINISFSTDKSNCRRNFNHNGCGAFHINGDRTGWRHGSVIVHHPHFAPVTAMLKVFLRAFCVRV